MLATIINNNQSAGSGMAAIFAGLGAVLGVICLLFAAVYIVTAIGLLKMKGWARIVGIILSAIGVLLQLPGLFAALARFHLVSLVWTAIWIGVDIAIIVYLLKPDVKAVFERRPAMAATA